MSWKYENLVAICHLQSDWINHHPQENQDLCMCLVTRKDHNYKAAGKLLIQEKEKQSCTIWELQEGLFTNGTGLQIVLWDVSGNPPIKGHLFTCPKPMSNSEQ
ncbi:hypothetical protein CY35_09G024000 [Sphagnum magellanicum]|nr:hypothetical protein CY35_09G024000 [Sphagnum magellanicum]